MKIAAALEQAQKHLQALVELVEKEPEIHRWQTCGICLLDSSLVQLFPREVCGETSEAQLSATKVAKAFGGNWTRHPDGSWHGDVPAVGDRVTIKVILHHVDPPSGPGRHIDLTAAA